ncbi:unnamed protein product [Penicillium nalgiovense]|uniref:Cation transporter n=1 Tax=Penicillium nalgiovense TaxID=60175 RepID=A0A9W4IAS1_PENNA|nr:unnamed protein product [Penicillium nalgiovense]CAG7951562.1 unnamed protein product [Penicillium nalgiovense]CAG7981253.1 unnamed protein product [Penicillium nalgiovense]CAG8136847.1 unnamed protein product [Penicillium nalgiovense]CAG8252796.1 unnamed protein product [Penicillium nalgiovense]
MPIMADLLAFSPLTLHYAYFILTPAIGSVIFYTASSHIHGLHYSDALFMCFSAMTGAGLSVVDLSTLSPLQQGTLFCLLILGHAFPIFAIISLFRVWKLPSALRHNSNRGKERQTAHKKQTALSAKATGEAKATTVVREVQPDVSSPCEPEGSSDDYGFIVVTDLRHPEQSQQVASIIVDNEKDVGNGKAHIRSLISRLKGMMQRAASPLSSREPINCKELGEVEYRALSLTAVLIILYFIGFLILGIVSIGLWSKFVRPDIPQEDGASPFWAGAFLATSALCNNGMSLVDTNMGSYQKEPFPLLVCGILILAGNTLFPCLLRFLIWGLRKILPNKPTWQLWRRSFDFTLTQSQKACAYLYPAWHTWFILGTVVVLNATMWGAFEVSAINNEEIGSLPVKFRVLDGLFQALAVRGGGFTVVAFDRLPQGLLILYVFMMYISAFPVSATISTKIAKTQFTDPPQKESHRSSPAGLSHARFVYQQLRSQFSHDIWWLSLAILLITITESDHFEADPLAFSTFRIIFEAVSAYSCVGVSFGYPGHTFSFCGAWHTFSKLLLVAVALRGRHRGLSAIFANADLFPESRGDTGEETMELEKNRHVNTKETSVGCV